MKNKEVRNSFLVATTGVSIIQTSYLYGAAGAAFGISENNLFWGANWNQILKTGLDESKDTYSIKRGINLYNKSIFRKQVSDTGRYV